MQLAWRRKNTTNTVLGKQNFINRYTFRAYNLIYWVPIILPFTKVIDYLTGFMLFFIILIIRATANIYRNNFLKLEQAESFPFRSP
jgi:hypothetical protein